MLRADGGALLRSTVLGRFAAEHARRGDVALVSWDEASFPSHDDRFRVTSGSRSAPPPGAACFDTIALAVDEADVQAAIRACAPALAQPHSVLLVDVTYADPARALGAIVDAANASGLGVTSIAPYGVLCGRHTSTPWLKGPYVSGTAWDRVLSYATVAPKMLDFCLFIEERLVGCLPLIATGQALAALRRSPVQGTNERWIDREQRLAQSLARGLSLETLAAFTPIDIDAYRRTIDAHLTFLPNRFLIVRLATALLDAPAYAVDFLSFMHERYAREQALYAARAGLDRRVAQICDTWLDDAALTGALTYDGFCLGVDLGYRLVKALLRDAFNAFPETQA